MKLLDDAKSKLGTDSAVAQYLKVPRSFISKVRHGEKPLPPIQAGKLAELLGSNPLEAAVRAMENQAEKPDERKKWREWSKYLGNVAAVLCVAVALFTAPKSGASEHATTNQVVGSSNLSGPTIFEWWIDDQGQ